MGKQKPRRPPKLPDAGSGQLEGTNIRDYLPQSEKCQAQVGILNSDGELLNDWNVDHRQPGVTTKLVFRHDEPFPYADIQATITYMEKPDQGPS
jgi:hypothetical protein